MASLKVSDCNLLILCQKLTQNGKREKEKESPQLGEKPRKSKGIYVIENGTSENLKDTKSS
jgi:hypothetical protein